MSVITGNRAKKTDLFFSAPRTLRTVNAEKHRSGNRIVHHIETAAVSDDSFISLNTENLSEKFSGFPYSFKASVIAAINIILGKTFARFLYDAENPL